MMYPNFPTLTPTASVVLAKLAKHVALLVCLMIVGGGPEIGQFGLFLLVVFAALVHALARSLQRRSALRLFRKTS